MTYKGTGKIPKGVVLREKLGRGVRIKAIQQAMQDIANMHGTMLANPVHNHNQNAEQCECKRGAAIRTLRSMLRNIFEE